MLVGRASATSEYQRSPSCLLFAKTTTFRALLSFKEGLRWLTSCIVKTFRVWD